ncbi:hypothetical protein KJ359_007277 [Pestalotiopsis sp. 9143b]|nr:hypothetical protein KJ359_007277 [Pestalotiopsis sp. 9143b]
MDYTNLKTRPDEPQTGHKDLDELIVLMREWRQDARTAAYMFFDDDLKEWSEGRYCPQDPLLDYKLDYEKIAINEVGRNESEDDEANSPALTSGETSEEDEYYEADGAEK